MNSNRIWRPVLKAGRGVMLACVAIAVLAMISSVRAGTPDPGLKQTPETAFEAIRESLEEDTHQESARKLREFTRKYAGWDDILQARVLLGRALVMSGDVSAGREELERIIEKSPDAAQVPMAYFYVAKAQEALGDFPGAVLSYQVVRNRFNDHDLAPQAALNEALLAEKILQNRKRARRIYEEFIRRYPDHERAPAVLNHLGLMAEQGRGNGQNGPAAPFMQDWQVIGPFPNPEGKGFDRSYPPEDKIALDATYEGAAESKVKWQDLPTKAKGKNGYVDFTFFEPKAHVCAYATTTIDSDRARRATLYLGSDDGVVAWLNGERVLSRDITRGARPDQEQTPIELKKGQNELLLKITQTTGTWGFFCRVDYEYAWGPSAAVEFYRDYARRFPKDPGDPSMNGGVAGPAAALWRAAELAETKINDYREAVALYKGYEDIPGAEEGKGYEQAARILAGHPDAGEAGPMFVAALEAVPGNESLRLDYARWLKRTKQEGQAHEQFRRLVKTARDDNVVKEALKQLGAEGLKGYLDGNPTDYTAFHHYLSSFKSKKQRAKGREALDTWLGRKDIDWKTSIAQQWLEWTGELEDVRRVISAADSEGRIGVSTKATLRAADMLLGAKKLTEAQDVLSAGLEDWGSYPDFPAGEFAVRLGRIAQADPLMVPNPAKQKEKEQEEKTQEQPKEQPEKGEKKGEGSEKAAADAKPNTDRAKKAEETPTPAKEPIPDEIVSKEAEAAREKGISLITEYHLHSSARGADVLAKLRHELSPDKCVDEVENATEKLMSAGKYEAALKQLQVLKEVLPEHDMRLVQILHHAGTRGSKTWKKGWKSTLEPMAFAELKHYQSVEKKTETTRRAVALLMRFSDAKTSVAAHEAYLTKHAGSEASGEIRRNLLEEMQRAGQKPGKTVLAWIAELEKNPALVRGIPAAMVPGGPKGYELYVSSVEKALKKADGELQRDLLLGLGRVHEVFGDYRAALDLMTELVEKHNGSAQAREAEETILRMMNRGFFAPHVRQKDAENAFALGMKRVRQTENARSFDDVSGDLWRLAGHPAYRLHGLEDFDGLYFYSVHQEPDNFRNSRGFLDQMVAGWPGDGLGPDDRVENNASPVAARSNNAIGGGDKFMIYRWGLLRAPRSGTYHFWGHADDWTGLEIDGQEHNFQRTRRNYHVAVELSQGLHLCRIGYGDWGGGYNMRVDWRPPGGKKQRLGEDAFSAEKYPLILSRAAENQGAWGVNQWDSYLEQYPNDRRAQMMRLETLTLAAPGEAIGELESLTKKYPGNIHFQSRLADCLWRIGRTGEALSKYRELASKPDSDRWRSSYNTLYRKHFLRGQEPVDFEQQLASRVRAAADWKLWQQVTEAENPTERLRSLIAAARRLQALERQTGVRQESVGRLNSSLAREKAQLQSAQNLAKKKDAKEEVKAQARAAVARSKRRIKDFEASLAKAKRVAEETKQLAAAFRKALGLEQDQEVREVYTAYAETALEEGSVSSALIFELAQELWSRKQYAACEPFLRYVVERSSNNHHMRWSVDRLVDLARRGEDTAKAVQILTRAGWEQPRDGHHARWLGRACDLALESGEVYAFARNAQLLARLHAKNKKLSGYLDRLGKVFENAGNYVSAEQEYKRVINRSRNKAQVREARLSLAGLDRKLGRPREAIKVLSNLVDLTIPGPNGAEASGRGRGGNGGEGAKQGEDAEALLLAARCYLMLEESHLARDAYDRAAAQKEFGKGVKPNRELILDLANSCLDKRRAAPGGQGTDGGEEGSLPPVIVENAEKALSLVDTLFRFYADDMTVREKVKATLVRADASIMMRNFPQAIEEIRGARKTAGDDPSRFLAELKMGEVHLATDNIQEALSVFRELAKLNREDVSPVALFWLGTTHLQMDKREEAVKAFRQLWERYAGSELVREAVYKIARTYAKQGAFLDAIRLYEAVGAIHSTPREKVVPGEVLTVKVWDADHFLGTGQYSIPVEVRSSSGDTENLRLEMNKINHSLFLGTIRTELGEASPNDQKLQVYGTDVIYVSYQDKFKGISGEAETEDKEENVRGQRRLSVIQVVENADVKVSPTEFVERDEDEEEEFYRKKTEEELAEEQRLKRLSARLERGEAVIRPGNPVYLRLQDADIDRSAERDTVDVNVFTYSPGEVKTRHQREKRRRLRERLSNPQGLKIGPEIPANGDFSWTRVPAPNPADRPRLDSTQVTLTETEPHSGIFYGTVKTDVNGPTAIASDHAGEKVPAYAIDGKNGADDAWLGFIDGKPGKWIEVDLKQVHNVSRIVWDRGAGADDRYMIDYTVTLRGDGTPTKIERKGNESAHNNEIKLEEPVECRWIRLTAQKYDGDAPAISQIQIFDAEGNLIVPPEVSPLERVKNSVLEFNVGDCMAAEVTDEENMDPGRPQKRVSNPMGVAYVDGHIDAVYTSQEENKVRGSVIHWIRSEQQRRRGDRGIPVYARRTKRVSPGEVLHVAIADPDLDLNSEKNTVKCELFSTSGDTATLTAKEIDNTAGIFTARVQTSPTKESGDSEMILWVRPNDHVKMRYMDKQNRDPGHAVYRNSFVFAAADEMAEFPQKVVNVESPQDDPESMEPPHWVMELSEPDHALPGIDRIEMKALSFATRDHVRFNVLLRDLDGTFTSKLPVEIMEKPEVQRPEGADPGSPRRVRPLDEWWWYRHQRRRSEEEEGAFSTPLAVSGDDIVYMQYADTTPAENAGRKFVPIVSGRFLGELQERGVAVSEVPAQARKEGIDVVLRDPATELEDARSSRLESVKREIAAKKLHYRHLLSDYETSLQSIGQQIDQLTGKSVEKEETSPDEETEETKTPTPTPEDVTGPDAPLTAENVETEGATLSADTLTASEDLIRAAALRRKRDKLTEAMRALKSRLDALGRYETGEIEEEIKTRRKEAKTRAEEQPEDTEKGTAKKKETPAWYEKPDWWKECGGMLAGTTLNVRVEDPDLTGENAVVVASILGEEEPRFYEFTASPVDGAKGTYEVRIPTVSGTDAEGDVLPVNGARDIMLTYRDTVQEEFPEKRAGYLSLASTAELAVTGPDFLEEKKKHHLGEDIFLLVRDPDMDKTNARDYLWVDVKSDHGDVERVPIAESQPHSGVFRGTVSTRFGEATPGDDVLCASFGGKFTVKYTDELWHGEQVIPPKMETDGFFVEGSDGTVEAFARQLRRGSLQRDVLFNTALAEYELGKNSTEMGAIQRGQRNLIESRDMFRLLVEHYTDDPVAAHATYYLGNIHFLLGNYPAAVESLQRVIDRWPDSEFKADRKSVV